MPLACPDQIGHALIGEQFGHQRSEFVESPDPGRDRVVPGVLELRRLTQPGPHTVPLTRREHAQPDVAVAATEYRVQILVLGPSAPSLAALAGGCRLTLGAERRIQGQHDGVEAGEVDDVADPAP